MAASARLPREGALAANEMVVQHHRSLLQGNLWGIWGWDSIWTIPVSPKLFLVRVLTRPRSVLGDAARTAKSAPGRAKAGGARMSAVTGLSI